MEDRYLFKAKGDISGLWHYGMLTFCGDCTCHIKDSLYNEKICNTSTLCQCTGLKNKNGKLIYENDIVKDLFSDVCAPIKYGSYQSCFDSTKTEHVGFYVDWGGRYTKRYRKDLGYWINMVEAEVVGNIFDNKELLESEG